MARTNTKKAAVRHLHPLLVIVLGLSALAAGLAGWGGGSTTPRLGLDLEGGTEMVLEPVLENGQQVSAGQIDQAVDMAIAAGLPADGWVTRFDKTIGEGSHNPNLANGKGLDHLIDTAGPTIVGIYFEIAGPPAP